MIITQTPYRLSLAGGGTDLPAHYRVHGGAAVNLALDSFFYISICRRLLPSFRIAYSRTENVARPQDIAHDITRAAFTRLGVTSPVEVTMTGEAPARTGLGSSSAVAVGLLHALAAMRGSAPAPEELAEQACTLELDWLRRDMGRQDQYGCAVGGAKLLRFHCDDKVTVQRLSVPSETCADLKRHALLLYLGQREPGSAILSRQSAESPAKAAILNEMTAQAVQMAALLERGSPASEIASLLHDGWQLKKSLCSEISSDNIDQVYERAIAHGALGGKLLGAGGAGFLFLIAPPERHETLVEALGRPPRLRFGISEHGTRVVFHEAPFVGEPAS